MADVEREIERFAKAHAKSYSKTKRQLSAIFEIGCFLAIADDCSNRQLTVTAVNLGDDGAYRYLTSPSGNPGNFSWLTVVDGTKQYDLRQQVRIRSDLDSDITFTPDMVLLDHDAPIEQRRDKDFAGGARGMFAVHVDRVRAIYECKSLPGFPELYVSFLGMALAARKELRVKRPRFTRSNGSGPIGTTLFVGGESSGLHLRMIAAMERLYPFNIVTGLHRGGWVLHKRRQPIEHIA